MARIVIEMQDENLAVCRDLRGMSREECLIMIGELEISKKKVMDLLLDKKN